MLQVFARLDTTTDIDVLQMMHMEMLVHLLAAMLQQLLCHCFCIHMQKLSSHDSGPVDRCSQITGQLHGSSLANHSLERMKLAKAGFTSMTAAKTGQSLAHDANLAQHTLLSVKG